MEQLNMFDMFYERVKIKNKIRLIELFAGIGAQAKALENLEKDGFLPKGFEHYRICEFDKYAVKSYNAIHNTNFETSDITKIHASDLGIVDTDKYTYIMTYSFPCQDISNAGKQRGFSRGIGTRSGLLWEVERLLNECEELPQILVMENVKNLLSEKFKYDFDRWIETLQQLGYKSSYKVMNAVDYGMPQNRERVFMISWLDNNQYYKFPKEVDLKWSMQDFLEDVADEKYFLPQDEVDRLIENGNIKVEES